MAKTLLTKEQTGLSNAGNSNYTFKLEVIENSTNISNNTSNLTINLYGKTNRSDYGYEQFYSPTAAINVDGTQKASSQVSSIISTTYKVIATYTGDIAHSSDGTMSITVDGVYNPNNTTRYLPRSTSISSTVALTTIPRASSFTLNKTSVTYDDTVTLTITRATSSFTHTVQISCNDDNWTNVATSVGTSYAYKLTTSVASRLIKSNNSIKFRLVTMNGSTQIGTTTSSEVKVTTPSSFAPTLTFEDTDVSGHKTKYGGYVRGKSQIKMKATVSLKNGAKISSLSQTYNNITDNTSTSSIEKTYTVSDTTFSATATDSRGLHGTNTKTITVYDYYSPKITNISVERCDSNGTAQDDGEYFKFSSNYDVASINSKNTKACSFKYRKSGTSTWTSSSITLTNYTGTISKIVSVDTEYSYESQISITDDFATSTVTRNVSTAYTLMDFGANGKSIALGKVSSNNGKFEVAMPAILEDGFTSFAERQASANIDSNQKGTVRSLKVTSTMTEGKPMNDGHMLHFDWDSTYKGQSQLYIPNASNVRSMQYRTYNSESDTWFDWKTIIDTTNITNYVGSIQEKYNADTIAVTSGSWADFTNVSLSVTAGTYVITIGNAWKSNTTGRRMIKLMASTDNGSSWTQIPHSLIAVAPPNANMTMAHTVIYQATASTQIKLQVLQDSGNNLNALEGYIRLVRII